MRAGAIGLYEEALQTAGAALLMRTGHGHALPLDIDRWSGPPDVADEELLSRCRGPVLDIGCGPGRLTVALAERGIPVLGVDIAGAAVARVRQAGACALRRSVFEPLPGQGRWATALLADGNIGIGGRPDVLLRHCTRLLAPGGRLLIEVENDDIDERLTAWLEHADGRRGPAFPWARIGASALFQLAAAAGLHPAEEWHRAGRAFVCVTTASSPPRAARGHIAVAVRSILRIGDAKEPAVRRLLRPGAHRGGSADHCRSSLIKENGMRKRKWLAAGGSLLAATIGLFGAATAASASTASPVVGYTYIDGNTATANTIDGFARHADGSVTPLPGSPFAAGGVGLGAGLASQGAIQATPDGRYLLAVDAGSNQVSVLRVTAGGVPVLAGQPVSSGGIKPVSVAISPSGLVYVANSGAGGSGYSGFRLHLDGSLTPIPGSTVTVPDSSGLGDVFFNALGDHLIGTRTGTSLIDSFVVLPGGHLLAAKGSPFTGQGLGQLGAEFSPAHPAQLFVSNAHNGAGLGTVSAYRDSLFGQLSPVGSSPYADGQTAPCWVEISHDGQYLFTVNTGSGNISSYSINPDGSLTLIGSTPISGGGADIDARLSPDGRTLSVDGSGNHILSVFAVNGGNLTELPSSPTPLPAGGAPAGIVSI